MALPQKTREEDPVIDTRWFKDRLRDRELSQRKLAKMLGTEPSAVSLMLNGKRRITLTEAADMSRLLGLPVNEVLEHAGIKPGQPKKSVPLVAHVDNDGELHPAKAGNRVAIDMTMPDTTVAVSYDDRANPYFGWTYFYEPRAGIDADCVGRMCVVELMSGQRFVRFLNPGKARGTYDLFCHAATTLQGIKVKTASPILWIKA